MYDFGALLTHPNEQSTDNLAYLSKHKPITDATQDTLDREPVYLVDENPFSRWKRLIERFITSW